MSQGEVSRELDALSCELLGDAFDRLAEGDDVNVLVVVEDARGVVTPYEFSDDGPEACLEAARARVRATKGAERYAIVYDGAVADEDGVYQDAVILEFGEKGDQAYSAFSLYEDRGLGDKFTWTDPQPAGEIDSCV